MSGEPYMDNSFKRANFPGNDLQISIHSVALPVMANIAQSIKVIGDWECITVADPEGVCPPPRY